MATGPATVMVVEDEVELADLFTRWLDPAYEVRTAYDADAALDAVDEAVDCVLLDRRMPGRWGDEVLDAIRDRGIDCRVAMVTAVQPDFDIVEMGFDDYIQKPVDKDELLSVVDDLLSLGSQDELMQQYFQLASKKASLETTKSVEELRSSDEYQRLVSELESVQAEANAHFEADEADGLFKDLL